MSTPLNPVLDAWQLALAAEHAAVYGYGALGPQLSDPGQVAAARSAELIHRALANTTMSELAALGVVPNPPAASYPLPWPLTDGPSAQRLALRLEEAAATAWRYLVAAAAALPVPAAVTPAPPPSYTGSGLAVLRAAAIGLVADSAVRAVGWRRLTDPADPSVAFPGI